MKPTKRHSKPTGPTRRQLVMGVLIVLTAGIVVRAAVLQLWDTGFFKRQAELRQVRAITLPADRGMILDRHGEPLAVSMPMGSIWVDPKEFKLNEDYQQHIPVLARLLELTDPVVRSRIDSPDTRRFVWLKRMLPLGEAEQIMAMNLRGLHSEREYKRFYPTAEVTSHLLGHTNIDDHGQEGLELAFDTELRGQHGIQQVLQDNRGRRIQPIGIVQEPEPGQTLTLSIDRRIQYLAYRALKSAVIENKAKAASAVVLDVTTGEILAMVNQPAANPNDRRTLKGKLLRNRAVTDVFEPGSTLKPFTVALALETNTYRLDSPIDTRPGIMRVGRNRVRDVHNYGLIDVATVITKSSNVGVSKIALSMPPEQMWQLYRDLGFGQRTGLGFKAEQSGFVSHYSGWGEFEYATHSFGYGVSVTALQLAQSYAVLAADGLKRPLSLQKLDQPPTEVRRVLSADTARKVRSVMETVISREGTALKAAIPGYRVAGKTGTVHKIVNGRYAPRQYRSLFAGMVPASRPRLVMAVMIDEPNGRSHYGGQVAAPVFKEVMEGALRLLGVPPDNLSDTQLQMAGFSQQ